VVIAGARRRAGAVVFYFVILTALVGLMAHVKNRSVIGWLLLSAVLSPLLAGLILLVLPTKREAVWEVILDHEPELPMVTVPHEPIKPVPLTRSQNVISMVGLMMMVSALALAIACAFY
jgi:hypothetical protein